MTTSPLLYMVCLTILIQTVDCLDCYQCHGVSNTTACHHVVECGSDEYCFTDTTGVGDDTQYTLGCRSKQVCLANAHTPFVGPSSIFGRSLKDYMDCSQCCAVDGCNKRMCTRTIQAVGPGECKDDPEFNCFFTSSLYTLCDDVHHAKLVCRQYCRLCDLIDGQWSPWNQWSYCDHTCGNGTRYRSRQCDNPAPQHQGLPCNGAATETESCFIQHCPGVWTPWSSYSDCSVTCGPGISKRVRNCHGGQCFGSAVEEKPCFTGACHDGGWSSWSPWFPCNVTCDGGLSERIRHCNNPPPSTYGRYCQGQAEEFRVCNSIPCNGNGNDTDGQWSTWTMWSNCSSNCMRTRTRSCDNPPPTENGRGCAGDSIEKLSCDFIECAVPVRLINGSTRYEGRLMVFHNGLWGTVCRDGFTDVEARVVCGMLNYPKEHALAVMASTTYGVGSPLTQILLDDVSCTGNEHSLFECSHSNWGVTDCTYTEIVGVSCIPHLHIRLTGGDANRGLVEVSLDNTAWGTLCSSGFSSNDNGAKVVCKMLGLSWQRAYFTDRYKHGTGEIYLTNIACTGTESNILECDHSVWGMGTEQCYHSQDVGVVCA